MNFDLTPEQMAIKKLVREFAENEIAPKAAEIDENHEIPRGIIDKMAELQLLGLPFPEEYEGGGADNACYYIAVEEIGRVCGSTGITLAAHVSLGCSPIYYFGSEEQKQKYLVPGCRGESLLAFGLTEPNAGSDSGGTQTTAVLDGDEWVINGSKCFITNAGWAHALTVTVVTEKGAGTRGISNIIVPTDTPGLTINCGYKKLGLKGSNTCELFFDNVRVSKENLLGELNKGFKQFMKILDGGRISIAALSVGLAQGAFEASLKYAKERVQFGQTISKFQAIQFKLADMAMHIEMARNQYLKAAWLKDNGRPFSKEAAMAKLWASEAGMQIALQAVQIHGGYGYMSEYPVERIMRDIKLMEIGEGTSEVQRVVLAKLLGC